MATNDPLDPANLTYFLKDGGTICPRSEGFTVLVASSKMPRPNAADAYLISFENPDTGEGLTLKGETEKEGDRPLYVILDKQSPGAKEIIALKPTR